MRILVLILPMILFGCADSSQTGVDKQIDILVKINIDQEAGNKGHVYVNPNLDWETLSKDNDLESSAAADASPDFDIKAPIGTAGGTAVSDSTAEGLQSTQDNRQEDVGNPLTTTDNSVREVVPSVLSVLPDVTVLDLDTVEEYDLTWSDPDGGRGRWVTWLKHPALYYGLPIEFTVSGSCSGTYVIEELNPKYIGETAFTVVDDFHFGSGNPKAAEVLAPLTCTGPTKLTVKFKAQ